MLSIGFQSEYQFRTHECMKIALFLHLKLPFGDPVKSDYLDLIIRRMEELEDWNLFSCTRTYNLIFTVRFRKQCLVLKISRLCKRMGASGNRDFQNNQCVIFLYSLILEWLCFWAKWNSFKFKSVIHYFVPES